MNASTVDVRDYPEPRPLEVQPALHACAWMLEGHPPWPRQRQNVAVEKMRSSLLIHVMATVDPCHGSY